MPEITTNGRLIEAEVPCPLDRLLESLNLMPRSVVVELNGEAVPPSAFAGCVVKAGDRLEIVRIVAGG